MGKEVKVVAIHLPQFHPFPENDEWWGKGFTEWSNVTKAKPLFKNHIQPKLSTDMGYYDLRLSNTHDEQAQLAKSYGIDAFCYYHYWFSGKKLMHRAIDAKLKSENKLPFMFCWANETWSRRWLGEEKEVLIKQEYSEEDHENHAKYLVSIFKDNRYYKINKRPFFLIYRPNDISNIEYFFDCLNIECQKENIEKPFLVASNSHGVEKKELFDARLNFEPQLGLLKNAFLDGFIWKRLFNNFFKFGVFSGRYKLYDYNEVKDIMMNRILDTNTIPCVFVGWDNTPRRNKNGIVILNQNVEKFKDSLIDAKSKALSCKLNEQIVFINAWNEWAEGNFLEPSIANKNDYLKVVKEVFGNE